MVENFKSKNVSVKVVMDRVNELIKNADVCRCDKCLGDIYAISLNGVNPHYVNTQQGEKFVLEEMFDQKYLKELDAVIFKAIDIVKSSPRH